MTTIVSLRLAEIKRWCRRYFYTIIKPNPPSFWMVDEKHQRVS